MTDYKLRFTIISIILIIIFSTPIRANVIDDILYPLQGFDFSTTYASYSSFIDFTIFVILFIGLAQVTIGKRFDSKGGKAMVVAIGLVLAIGLVISESMIGFNLQSFGPLAAAIFIFLVGLVIYQGMRGFGMEVVGSVAIAVVLTYFSIRSVTPGIFDWILDRADFAWFHSVILVAVIIAAFKLFKLLFPSENNSLESSPHFFAKNRLQKSRDWGNHLNENREHKKMIKSKMQKIASGTQKDYKQVVNELTLIKNTIKKYGSSDYARQKCIENIRNVYSHKNVIIRKIAELKELVRKISNNDIHEFSRLQSEYHKIDETQKKLVEKELKIGWKKLDVEKRMLKLDGALSEYNKLFKESLRSAVSALQNNNNSKAIKYLDRAIDAEKNSGNILYQVLKLEKSLMKIIDKDIKLINRKGASK